MYVFILKNNVDMSNLPSDVIIGIARYLTAEEFYNFSLVSLYHKKNYDSFFIVIFINIFNFFIDYLDL